MKKLEDQTDAEIAIEAAKYGSILMRNNSGAFNDGTRQIRYGLGNISKRHSDRVKSSDRIGPTTIVITQEMVGKTIAVFTAIESKKEGWKFSENDTRSVAQKNFIDWINHVGGIAGFATSADDFRKILTDFLAKLKAPR